MAAKSRWPTYGGEKGPLGTVQTSFYFMMLSPIVLKIWSFLCPKRDTYVPILKNEIALGEWGQLFSKKAKKWLLK